MKFKVLSRFDPLPRPDGGAFLIRDAWDDFGYQTMFHLLVPDRAHKPVDIGTVKIANTSMEIEGSSTRTDDTLTSTFQRLDKEFYSLGQDDTYYEKLNSLGIEKRNLVLKALRDVAFNPDILHKVRELDAFKTSLLRGFNEPDVELERLALIARGRDRIIGFRWNFTPQFDVGTSWTRPKLTFEANPKTRPSTNIHALIGRNGVGKSRILRELAHRVASGDVVTTGVDDAQNPKSANPEQDQGSIDGLTNVVAVSFGAFDSLYADQPASDGALAFTYIGLHTNDPESPDDLSVTRLKSNNELANEFASSLELCMTGARRHRWLQAVETLTYSGSGFLDQQQQRLGDLVQSDYHVVSPKRQRRIAKGLYNELSSGHKVVLLTITRLVECVTERTLVLIDEPETHLHPPLLSAFVRSLSDLLTERNGMAILATHSPVVLQEIPSTCVWKLNRQGEVLNAIRPMHETYGENVGELTHDVFRLEVEASGYYQALAKLVDQDRPYEEIIGMFTGLGTEARSLLRAMVATRRTGHDD